MRFTQKIKYNLKHAIPMLAIAGAGLMASCDKDDDTYDVELEFCENSTETDYSSINSIEHLKQLSSDPQVANIYMKVLDKSNHTGYGVNGLHRLRNYMEERINVSKKIHGRGNFKFRIGRCALEDSLWLVQQGWTINQHLQNQK